LGSRARACFMSWTVIMTGIYHFAGDGARSSVPVQCPRCPALLSCLQPTSLAPNSL
jgi:hypothetical protein